MKIPKGLLEFVSKISSAVNFTLRDFPQTTHIHTSNHTVDCFKMAKKSLHKG